MRRYLLLLISVFLLCTLACTGCASENENIPADSTGSSLSPDTNDNGTKSKTFTLLVYICGSDLESRFGKATENIAEMQSAEVADNVNVVVQTGGAKSWHDISVSARSTDRFLIKSGEKQLIDRNTVKQNFGESQTLVDFITFGVEQYPADNYGLVLWDHGAGSIGGVCFDANFGNDGLTLLEMKEALASTQEKLGKKFDFIGFDACLMATYDVACILAPYANYMIASEELEPSSGWDYKTLLSSLSKETFYTDVLNAYAEKQSTKATYTLSVIDLSKMVKADDVISVITQQIHDNVGYVGKALSEGKEFGSKGTGGGGSNLFDLGLIADSLGIEYDFDGFITTVNGTAHEDATGMSLYFPTEQEKLIEEYRAICQNELYMEFLTDYFNYRPETPIEFAHKGYDNNGCLSFALTELSGKYVQSVGYELHSFAGSEETQKLYCVGTDDDISYANGVYTVNFEGSWIFANDILLHTNIYEVKGSHTVFSTIVKIDGEICQLLFTCFKPTQTITIEGYIIQGDQTSRVHELNEGMKITVIYEDPIPEDGQRYYEEGTLIWGKDVMFSTKKVDVGYYQYIPYVIDIYGNIYYGHTAIVYFDGEKSIMQDIAAG